MRNDTLNIEIPKKSFKNYSDYRNVYSNLIENVDEVLNDISKIDIQHIEVKAKNEEVQSKLKDLRDSFVDDLRKLDKNVVWDRFTIAFFGETNAGKSTIIESLRISMHEDEKLKNTTLKKSLDLSISELNVKSEEFITSIIESKQRQVKGLTSQLENIKERAKILEVTFWANWFNALRSWFGILPIIFFAKKIKLLEDELFEVHSIIPEQNKTVLELFGEIAQLKKDRKELFDGKIIGTGVQDFTQSCIEYQFNKEEKPFTLIDVPGIEGNEGKYEAMIMDAVSKAHCVFYVCSAGKLPESGTIAKIKKYLKEQTEVYFLLNERKNTYSYEKVYTFEAMHPSIEEFKRSISNQMQNELGEFYKGCCSLQGLMAFCSIAEIHEEERNFKFQKKLLDKFETLENLHSISQLEKVETLIRSQLNEMERKIINANVQKAICATIDFKSNIQEIRNTEYSDDFVQIIEKEIKVVKEKNDNELRQLEDGLNQVSNSLPNSSIEYLRKKLYHLVENKENNSQLNVSDAKSLQSPFYSDKEKKIKFIANCYNRYVFEELSQKYMDSTRKAVDTFTNDVYENIIKMQSNIKQITLARFSSDYDNHIIGSFDLLFSFDWMKIGNVVMSVGGMAITGATLGSVFPGIGNVVGAVAGAVVGLLFVGYRWLIDKESPESKAKKQIDEKLPSMKTEIKTKLDSSNKNIIDDCKKNVINKVRIMLDDNMNGIKAIQSILNTKTSQLERLIEEIKNSKN
jgi:gas vesicle protein